MEHINYVPFFFKYSNQKRLCNYMQSLFKCLNLIDYLTGVNTQLSSNFIEPLAPVAKYPLPPIE